MYLLKGFRVPPLINRAMYSAGGIPVPSGSFPKVLEANPTAEIIFFFEDFWTWTALVVNGDGRSRNLGRAFLTVVRASNMVELSATEVIKGIWRLNYWFRDRESFLTSDETESINLVREYRIISAHCLRGQNLEEYAELSKDHLLTR